MFRFTIRELVLLTAVVGLALGWGLDRRKSQQRFEAVLKDRGDAIWKLDLLERALTRENIAWHNLRGEIWLTRGDKKLGPALLSEEVEP